MPEAISSRGLLSASLTLLDAADEISDGPEELAAQDAQVADALRRRAISTAYYAVFHQVCLAIATRVTAGLLEEDRQAVFNRAYRTLEHGALKKTAGRMAASFQDGRPEEAAIRDLCLQLVELQTARMSADYDPAYAFSPDEARRLVEIAEEQWPYFIFEDDPGAAPYVERLVAELLVRSRER